MTTAAASVINAAARPSGGDAASDVQAAIQKASAKTGVDFSYMLAQAKIESGLRANAKASTSSATGLYQFIESTWLDMVDRHGAAHGLGAEADAIRRDGAGRLVVDEGARARILALRNDPDAASAMAAEYARENADHIQARTGVEAGKTELYLAHFLGSGGASTFLNAHRRNPDQAAADLFPAAAAANRPTFYRKDGTERTLGEIYDLLAQKIGADGTGAVVAKAPQPSFVERAARALQGVTMAEPDDGFELDPAILAQMNEASDRGQTERLSLFGLMMIQQMEAPKGGNDAKRAGRPEAEDRSILQELAEDAAAAKQGPEAGARPAPEKVGLLAYARAGQRPLALGAPDVIG